MDELGRCLARSNRHHYLAIEILNRLHDESDIKTLSVDYPLGISKYMEMIFTLLEELPSYLLWSFGDLIAERGKVEKFRRLITSYRRSDFYTGLFKNENLLGYHRHIGHDET